MSISLSPLAPENVVARDGFGSPVPGQPARLHTQAESDGVCANVCVCVCVCFFLLFLWGGLLECSAPPAGTPQLELTPKEQDQKKKLIDAAFGDWTRKDFRAFVAATERHGRDDTEAVVRDVCLETAKTEENVRKYIKVLLLPL